MPLFYAGQGAEEKVVPADMLLLAGSCIVEEAVLTGESTPQWKLPIGTLTDAGARPEATAADTAASDNSAASSVTPALEHGWQEHLSIKRDKAHMLFGGTKILQHTGDKDARIKTPDGGCLAVVLRTGFETSQGKL